MATKNDIIQAALNKVRNFTSSFTQPRQVGSGQGLVQQATTKLNQITPGGIQGGVQRVKDALRTNPQQFNIFATPEFKKYGIEPLTQGFTSALKFAPPYQTYRSLTGSPVTPKEALTDLSKVAKGVGAATLGPAGYVASAAFGAALNPRNPIQGAYQGIEAGQQYGGLTRFTSPLISRIAPSGVLASKIGQGALNVGENIVQDIATGRKTTPLDVALGFGMGIAGKPFGGTNVRGAAEFKKPMASGDVESALKNIDILNSTKPEDIQKGTQAEKMIREIAGDYIGKQFAKTKDIKTVANELINRINVDKGYDLMSMGIVGKKDAQDGLYDTKKVGKYHWFNTQTKQFEPVTNAKPVEVIKGVDTFISRNPQYPNSTSEWVITEAKSGARVSGGGTQKAAIEQAQQRFSELKGKGMTPQQLIEQVSSKNGVSPSYRQTNVAQQPLSDLAQEARKYKTIHYGNEIKEVEGYPIKIVNGIDTFIHKGDGGWIVSEASTGRHFAESRSKEGAIAKAGVMLDEQIKKFGNIDKLKEFINTRKLSDNTLNQATKGVESMSNTKNIKYVEDDILRYHYKLDSEDIGMMGDRERKELIDRYYKESTKGVETIQKEKNLQMEQVKDILGGKVSKVRLQSLANKEVGQVGVPSKPIITEKGKLNVNRLNVGDEGKKVLSAIESEVEPTVLGNKDVIKASANAKGKGPLTDEQMKKMIASQLKNRQLVVDLTQKFEQAKASGASEQELAKIMIEIADQSKAARTGGTFAGRLLQAQNIMADKTASPMQKIFALLDNAGINEQKYLKDAVKVDWNNPTEVVSFYRKYVPPKFGEILDEIRYTNMLSSPLTHIVNTASNAIQTAVVTPIEKVLTGVLDFGQSKLTGKQREYYARSGIDYAGGYVRALPDAFKKAWRVISGEDINIRPDFEYMPTAVGGPLKAYTTPLRVLEAADQFFRTLVEGGVSRQLKLGPQKLSPQKIATTASKEADYRLFRQAFDPNGELGQGTVLQFFDKWNSGIAQLRRLPGGKWILPFLQTPTNILKQGVEYSPLGVSTIFGAKNKTEQLAKTMIGTMVFAGAYELGKGGMLSWEAPSNEKEKELYYAAGMQPYSVKIGNNWVSYSNFGPLSYPLAMAAALSHAEKRNPDKKTYENVGTTIGGMLKFFGDKSYVRSIGDIVDAIQGGVNIGQTAISAEAANLAGQLMPYRSFLTWMGGVIDPTYRKAKTFGERMVKDLPVLGSSLEPYTTPTGEPSVRDYPVLNAFNPYKVTREKGAESTMLKDYQSKKIIRDIEKRTEKELEAGAKQSDIVGKTYMYVNEDGDIKKINLEYTPPELKLTGNYEIDKDLTSEYKSDITKRQKELIELNRQGVIDDNKLFSEYMGLESLKSTATSKTSKVKKIKAKFVPLKIKGRKTKLKSLSKKGIKLVRPKKFKEVKL